MIMALADIILVVHFLFVLFVIGSLPLIWVGSACGLNYVRNRHFRLIHLGSILFVAGESLFGFVCPLTAWEDELRQSEGRGSFIQRGLHFILFYDFPEGVLTIAYVLFALLVVGTLRWVPPR
jgi:hypothetical protein